MLLHAFWHDVWGTVVVDTDVVVGVVVVGGIVVVSGIVVVVIGKQSQTSSVKRPPGMKLHSSPASHSPNVEHCDSVGL